MALNISLEASLIKCRVGEEYGEVTGEVNNTKKLM
jgi:hypothetical protein